MKTSFFILVASASALLLPGCGASEEAAEEGTSLPPQQEQQPPVKQSEAQKRIEFETRTDTVTAVHPAEHRNAGGPGREVRIRYMVQIGAFKDPHNASAVQTEARKRYRMPVLNDYYAAGGLYQIRIGFFETRDRAYEFQQKMRQEYPNDYKDSWVVQLKR